MNLVLNVDDKEEVTKTQDQTDKDTAATIGLFTALYPPVKVYNLIPQPADGAI